MSVLHEALEVLHNKGFVYAKLGGGNTIVIPIGINNPREYMRQVLRPISKLQQRGIDIVGVVDNDNNIIISLTCSPNNKGAMQLVLFHVPIRLITKYPDIINKLIGVIRRLNLNTDDMELVHEADRPLFTISNIGIGWLSARLKDSGITDISVEEYDGKVAIHIPSQREYTSAVCSL